MENKNSNIVVKKVLFGVLNWGLGHATRSTPLIQFFLKKGIHIEIASDGLALEYLKKEFPNQTFHNLRGYDIQYSSKKNLLSLKLLCQIPKLKAAIDSEKKKVEEIISQNKFDLVLSDNRYGFRSSSIKSLLISHQLTLITPTLFKGVNKVLSNYQKEFNSILIPDLEDKKMRLSGKLSKTKLSHHFINPISIFNNHTYEEPKKDIDYLIVLSGPEPQRTLLEKKLIDLTPKEGTKIVIVRGTEQPFKQKTGIETHNLVQKKDLEVLIRRSKKMISRSGYTTIMDLHFLQIPCILIPTPGQTEQQYLAERLADNPIFLIRLQNQLTSEIFDWEPSEHKKSLPEYSEKAFENALLLEGLTMPT